MEEDGYTEYNRTTFTITQKQTDYLKTIDNNQSAALRKALDTLINKQKKDAIRDNILTLCIGCIFLFFATMTVNVIVIWVATVFGFFICIYAIWSMNYALRRTKS